MRLRVAPRQEVSCLVDLRPCPRRRMRLVGIDVLEQLAAYEAATSKCCLRLTAGACTALRRLRRLQLPFGRRGHKAWQTGGPKRARPKKSPLGPP